MQTIVHPDLAGLPEIQEAEAILRKCVHCGFCTATCPTYQLLGDELDGPRGRIYLIKNMLEDNVISSDSVVHLDRCLTCRACETTCPSGVEYGRLLDIGRDLVNERATRPLVARFVSRMLRTFVPRHWLFRPILFIGQTLRPVLPGFLRTHVPPRMPVKHHTTSVSGARVLLLSGCVQAAATPNVVASLMKILGHQGMQSEVINEGCCGALDYHLSAHEAGIARMKSVIDQLYPRLSEVDYIVSSATGCGVTIRDYPVALKYDAEYHGKAVELVAKLADPVELVEGQAFQTGSKRVAVHTPCSMQHGMGITGRIEQVLAATGAQIVPHRDGHLCCGSAGTYSIMQPELSGRLKQRKALALSEGKPDIVVTANIGCQLQLQDGMDGMDVPVMHWLEFLADHIETRAETRVETRG